MEKIRKSFLRNSVMMLSLVAAMALGSSVAYAQECLARAQGATTARATGITEAVGGVEILCRERPAGDFGFGSVVPAEITLSIELNTTVTNQEGDNDEVDGLTYMGASNTGSPSLGDVQDYEADTDNANEREVLSSDGTTISWKLLQSELSITTTAQTVTIGGIMANAAALGNGSDVTAVVRVNGEAVHTGSLMLAEVMTGLELVADHSEVASGLQCLDQSVTATVFFKEGFNSAFTDMDSLAFNLRGVPDGVTVMASMTGTGEPMDPPADAAADPPVPEPGDLAPLTLDASMGLVEDTEDREIELEDGAGQVVYNFDDEDAGTDELEGMDSTDAEWNQVEFTFEWDAGDPPLEMGTVTVSFHPVSMDADEDPTRFVAGPTTYVVEVEDCVTSLLFPFVTNQLGFDTGVAITNVSSEAGMCTLSFSGMEDDQEVMVMAESTATFGVSAMMAGFQGYIEAECAFRNGKGLAFITNGAGMTPSLAHGYLVSDELQASD